MTFITKIHLKQVRHEKNGNATTYFQQFNMRLQKPDDELGGMLLLMLPSEIVHRIDAWSPLRPVLKQQQQHNAISSYVPFVLHKNHTAQTTQLNITQIQISRNFTTCCGC